MDRRLRVSFTLLELIVTMSIMAVISALLIGAFHTGAMSYGKIGAYERAALELSGALAFIKDDLRCFAPVDGRSVNFQGDKMSFYIVSATPSSHLELVSYSVKDSSLERTASSYLGKGLDEEALSPVSAVVLKDLEAWKFGYAGVSQPEGKDLPQGQAGNGGAAVRSWPKAVLVEGTAKGGKPILVSMLMPVFDLPGSGQGVPNPSERKP